MHPQAKQTKQTKQTKLQVRSYKFAMEPMFAAVSHVKIIENAPFEFYVKLGNQFHFGSIFYSPENIQMG